MYSLKKIKDTKFNGKHPNNINEGNQIVGTAISQILIGQPFYIVRDMKVRKTSLVVSIQPIIDKNKVVFNTLNSEYELTKDDIDIDFKFTV